MLKNNKDFWLINDFDNITISNLQKPLNEVKIKMVARGSTDWFTDPLRKTRANQFLVDGEKWSNGLLIELPAENYLKAVINTNEDVYLGVDIAFYDSKGAKVGGMIQEIDGLVFNSSSNKIETLISMKLDSERHTAGKDFFKLKDVMKNLPDSGAELKNYILNKPKLNAVKIKVHEIYEAKIIFKDLRTGKDFKELPSVFSQKIKTSHDEINNFQKIHPETLNTTKDDLMESSYQSIKNKM